jgi:nondiscriminating glutamyl-tRNA synthetase
LPFIEKTPYAGYVKQLDDQHYGVLVEAVRDHLVCLADIEKQLDVFFAEPQFEEEAWEVLSGADVKTVLEMFVNELGECQEVEEIKQLIKSITKKTKFKPKNVFMPLRCALSGRTHGPELPHLIFIWGREKSLQRVNKVLTHLPN